MRRLTLLASTLSLLLLSGAQAAQATAGSGAFHWEAGAGSPLCSFGPAACPDVAMASNGDTLTLTAEGDLNAANGAASGGGTFEHRTATGDLVASGTVTATGLLTFIPYGCVGVPPNLCGGRAAVAVHLVAHPAGNPLATVEADGILEVECALGNPPAGVHEGFRLNVKDLVNFNKSVTGFTLFVTAS